MMKTVSIFFHHFFFFLSFPLCAFSNVLILRDIFFLLLHNKEADRRLLCSQIAHYLVINLTKISPPRSTTCSTAPLPVITKHAFLICKPRVRVHKQFALRKVLGWFWIIKSWLMLFCVCKRAHVKWMLWNYTLRFWALSLHANIRCIHLLKERQRRPLICAAWRAEGLCSCQIRRVCLKYSKRSPRWSSPIPLPLCP